MVFFVVSILRLELKAVRLALTHLQVKFRRLRGGLFHLQLTRGNVNPCFRPKGQKDSIVTGNEIVVLFAVERILQKRYVPSSKMPALPEVSPLAGERLARGETSEGEQGVLLEGRGIWRSGEGKLARGEGGCTRYRQDHIRHNATLLSSVRSKRSGPSAT